MGWDRSLLKKYGAGFEAVEHSGAALCGRHGMPIGARLSPSDQGVERYVEFFNRLIGCHGQALLVRAAEDGDRRERRPPRALVATRPHGRLGT